MVGLMADSRKLKELFQACFREDRRWVNWFFSTVVSDGDTTIVADSDGRAVSGALLQEFLFRYEGYNLPGGYLSCVATLPSERGKGLAMETLRQTLGQAFERGIAVVSLIPAQRHLYSLYAKAGFAGVYYANEERYLAGHNFEEYGTPCEPSGAILRALEEDYGCGILHSDAQFGHIVQDLALEEGHITIASGGDDGARAILFAKYNPEKPGSAIEVKCLLAKNEDLAQGLLQRLQTLVPDRGMTVRRPPSDFKSPLLRASGMARITDVRQVLDALAAAHPKINATIRVRDSILVPNNLTLHLHQGNCTDAPGRRPTLDVDIQTLTAVLMSASPTGEIFDLPTRRPYMAMMLD